MDLRTMQQSSSPSNKDWIQSAIEQGHIDYLELDKELNEGPVFYAREGFLVMYLAAGKKHTKQMHALKCLREQPKSVEADPVGYKNFINELQFLRQIDDENFVARYHGISRHPTTNAYLMVMKHVEQGSLTNYLKKNAGRLTWAERLRLACQVAEALNYIHNKGAIHRNLHSDNILWGRALIADLGLSGVTVSKISKLTISAHIPYIPPELIARSRIPIKDDARSDIYSLGVVLWDISGDGTPPFPDVDFLTAEHIFQGLRADPIEGTPQEYIELYMQCWDGDPSKRPGMIEILTRLHTMAKAARRQGWGSKFAIDAAYAGRHLQEKTAVDNEPATIQEDNLVLSEGFMSKMKNLALKWLTGPDQKDKVRKGKGKEGKLGQQSVMSPLAWISDNLSGKVDEKGNCDKDGHKTKDKNAEQRLEKPYEEQPKLEDGTPIIGHNYLNISECPRNPGDDVTPDPR
ncbi:kinase-like domain-containing protein [Jimgerdemannia flammicorona]|uniref:Kinase-like domain-containing protein n=1 Tax=Jimgerdemannia flammicorona TaxID=994334 RepID=A0A433QR32_9FUNG|nr:kinase-like domain-containing protein [Jimgerdemannia flammicorona]